MIAVMIAVEVEGGTGETGVISKATQGKQPAVLLRRPAWEGEGGAAVVVVQYRASW